MGADCKSAGYAYAGSNPARPTTIHIKVKSKKLKVKHFNLPFLIFMPV
jgi:hypothetical protein